MPRRMFGARPNASRVTIEKERWARLPAPARRSTSMEPGLAHRLDQVGDDAEVTAGERGEADHLGVLLEGGVDELTDEGEADEDDLHPRLHELAHDEARADVVGVESHLAEHHADHQLV